MSARFAVLSGSRARAVRIPARPSSWRLRGSLRHLDPRPGTDGGYPRNVISRFLPQQRQILYLSFALADPKRLQHLLASAGFRDIRVEREIREYIIESFDDYWEPIEAGIGSLPHAYLMLSETDRGSVREEVKERLSRFESGGRLLMSIEMLIGSGR